MWTVGAQREEQTPHVSFMDESMTSFETSFNDSHQVSKITQKRSMLKHSGPSHEKPQPNKEQRFSQWGKQDRGSLEDSGLQASKSNTSKNKADGTTKSCFRTVSAPFDDKQSSSSRIRNCSTSIISKSSNDLQAVDKKARRNEENRNNHESSNQSDVGRVNSRESIQSSSSVKLRRRSNSEDGMSIDEQNQQSIESSPFKPPRRRRSTDGIGRDDVGVQAPSLDAARRRKSNDGVKREEFPLSSKTALSPKLSEPPTPAVRQSSFDAPRETPRRMKSNDGLKRIEVTPFPKSLPPPTHGEQLSSFAPRRKKSNDGLQRIEVPPSPVSLPPPTRGDQPSLIEAPRRRKSNDGLRKIELPQSTQLTPSPKQVAPPTPSGPGIQGRSSRKGANTKDEIMKSQFISSSSELVPAPIVDKGLHEEMCSPQRLPSSEGFEAPSQNGLLQQRSSRDKKDGERGRDCRREHESGDRSRDHRRQHRSVDRDCARDKSVDSVKPRGSDRDRDNERSRGSRNNSSTTGSSSKREGEKKRDSEKGNTKKVAENKDRDRNHRSRSNSNEDKYGSVEKHSNNDEQSNQQEGGRRRDFSRTRDRQNRDNNSVVTSANLKSGDNNISGGIATAISSRPTRPRSDSKSEDGLHTFIDKSSTSTKTRSSSKSVGSSGSRQKSRGKDLLDLKPRNATNDLSKTSTHGGSGRLPEDSDTAPKTESDDESEDEHMKRLKERGRSARHQNPQAVARSRSLSRSRGIARTASSSTSDNREKLRSRSSSRGRPSKESTGGSSSVSYDNRRHGPLDYKSSSSGKHSTSKSLKKCSSHKTSSIKAAKSSSKSRKGNKESSASSDSSDYVSEADDIDSEEEVEQQTNTFLSFLTQVGKKRGGALASSSTHSTQPTGQDLRSGGTAGIARLMGAIGYKSSHRDSDENTLEQQSKHETKRGDTSKTSKRRGTSVPPTMDRGNEKSIPEIKTKRNDNAGKSKDRRVSEDGHTAAQGQKVVAFASKTKELWDEEDALGFNPRPPTRKKSMDDDFKFLIESTYNSAAESKKTTQAVAEKRSHSMGTAYAMKNWGLSMSLHGGDSKRTKDSGGLNMSMHDPDRKQGPTRTFSFQPGM